ncbi:MAG: hypothetical protein GWN30_00460 [Gammaproteobacteria bacterium]|nr:hypothetical protein [Gammaproteobacteria bacterium]NIW96987.1 hypothetical protein [Phycisphaerae bacterium]
MIDLKTEEQIQQASMAERIQLIKLILKSLKRDMKIKSTAEKPPSTLFRVRQFNLGQEVEVDREGYPVFT